MKKIILTLLSFGTIFTSCRKSAVPPQMNVKNLPGNYILTAMRISATGVPEQDAFSTLPDCEKDDLYEFREDSSFTHIDTGMVCQPSEGKYEGSWKLDGDQISFYGQTGTITKWDGNNMEVTATSTDQETTYVVTSTYEKQ